MQVALEIVHDHVPLQTALARCASWDGLYRKVMERIERCRWGSPRKNENCGFSPLDGYFDGTTSPLLERDTAFQDLPAMFR